MAPPCKAIPYWIQRADFSATDHEPVEVADGLRAFESHDWRLEIEGLESPVAVMQVNEGEVVLFINYRVRSQMRAT
jgi:hypothetical protein